jgi:hypothetical protein
MEVGRVASPGVQAFSQKKLLGGLPVKPQKQELVGPSLADSYPGDHGQGTNVLRFTPFIPTSGTGVSHTLNIWRYARIQFPCFFDSLSLGGRDRRCSLGVRPSDCVIPLWTLLHKQFSFGFTHRIAAYPQKLAHSTIIGFCGGWGRDPPCGARRVALLARGRPRPASVGGSGGSATALASATGRVPQSRKEG